MIQTEIKAHRSFVDPFFKSPYKGSLILSMQIGRDGMSFAILDTEINTSVVIKEYIFEDIQSSYDLSKEFERVFSSSELLKIKYDDVVVGIINQEVSLIPEAIFNENQKENFIQFTQGKKENDVIAEDKLINLKARNLYYLAESLKSTILSKFPFAKIKHASSSLIDGLTLHYKQAEGDRLAIHLQYSHFELLYFVNGRLQYFNSFNYTTAEDFIYYVLFAFEQLGLNSETIPVEVFGEVDNESSTFGLLYKYVRHVSFGKRPDVLKYSPSMDLALQHHYFNLFQQFLCA
jgi:hypothetical protein